MLLAVIVQFTLKAVSELVLLQRKGIEMHKAGELQAQLESIQFQEYSVSVVSRQKLDIIGLHALAMKGPIDLFLLVVGHHLFQGCPLRTHRHRQSGRLNAGLPRILQCNRPHCSCSCPGCVGFASFLMQ